MPLSSEDLLRERRSRVARVLWIVGDNEPVSKKALLAKIRKCIGVRRSTAYDYLETLIECDDLVEDDGFIWTRKTHATKVQERIARENERERLLTATMSLDAYDTEDVGR